MNRTIVEDLEQKVLALRVLLSKLRDEDAGDSFAGVVARSRSFTVYGGGYERPGG